MKAYKLLIAAVFMALPVISSADNLPALAADGMFAQGKMTDGINYCIITNAAMKGTAEFALLQRVSPAESSDSRAEVLKSCLKTLPRFGRRSLQGLGISKGAAFGPEGMIQTFSDAVLLRMPGIYTTYGDVAIDSLLLGFFDIIATTSASDDAGYGTTNQTLIIAGDVNAAALKSKFGVFSLMIPSKSANVPSTGYTWTPSQEPVVELQEAQDPALGSFKVTYRIPRTDKALLGTVVMAMTERMDASMETILRKRLMKEFSSAGIPCAGVDVERVTSFNQPSDESFSVSVTVAASDLEKAVEKVGTVLSELDGKCVRTDEYSLAQKGYVLDRKKGMTCPVDNSVLVDRYVSYLLYGTDLAGVNARLSIFNGKQVDAEAQTKHFNQYMSSILDLRENITLSCTSAVADAGSVKAAFEKGWNVKRTSFSPSVNQADTLSFPDGRRGKYKPKKTETDDITGGTMWTFSNGVRVICKKMATSGISWYSLSMNAGASTVSGVTAPEAAFYGDILNMCDVGSLAGHTFMTLLNSNDITMECKVSLSDVSLCGTAPSDKMSLLMKSLLMMTTERETSSRDYQYYIDCEKLRLQAMYDSPLSRRGRLEAHIHPDFNYSLYRNADALTQKTMSNAEAMLSSGLSRINEGILLIVTDREPDAVLAEITPFVSQFPVSGSRLARKSVQVKTIAGTKVVHEKGDIDGVDILMSTELHYTADNYYAAHLAACAVQGSLDEAFGYTDICAEVGVDAQTQPQEAVNMTISLRHAPLESLGPDSRHFENDRAVAEVDKVLADMAVKEITAAQANAYKAVVSGRFAAAQASPGYWVEAVRSRYMEGKNLSADFAGKIGAVTPARIREIVAQFNTSARVDCYIDK